MAKKVKKSSNCPHPSSRLYAWHAHDGTLCVCCCACGAVLRGGVDGNQGKKVNPGVPIEVTVMP